MPSSKRFASYAETTIGQRLATLIDVPERVIEFRLMSSLGKPAVQAIAADVAPIINALPTKADRDSANQFCGWRVGQIMRELGYDLINERGRVSDAPYKTGAVWRHLDQPVEVVTSVPVGRARVDLSVRKSEGGDVIADWEAVISARDAARRIHQIGALSKPVRAAFREAVAYAERWGIPFLWVKDPSRLFPREQWDLE